MRAGAGAGLPPIFRGCLQSFGGTHACLKEMPSNMPNMFAAEKGVGCGAVCVSAVFPVKPAPFNVYCANKFGLELPKTAATHVQYSHAN